MRLEKEPNTNLSPEKLAMLEKMKAKFYADLNHRMEAFFKDGTTHS